MYTLSLFYPARNLGLAFTCVTTATAVAGLLGAPLAAGLMSLDGLAGLRGWQILFLAEGFPPLLLAAALPFALPGSPLSAGFLTPAEQQWLWGEVNGQQAGIELVGTAGGLAAAGAEGDVPPRGGDIERVALLQPADRPGSDASPKQQDGQEQHEQRKGALYGSSSGSGGGGVDRGLSAAAVRAGLLDRRVWHLAAVMLLIDVAMNAVNFWLPTLVKAALQGELQSDGGSGIGGTGGAGGAPAATSTSTGLLVKASLLSALPFCGAAVCMVANAHHARLRDERRLHTALPLLAAGLALAAVPLLAGAASPAPALAALTVAASGIWATHGPFFR
jgi:preprotein translocase subunit SecG